jgi:hypothetical protein
MSQLFNYLPHLDESHRLSLILDIGLTTSYKKPPKYLYTALDLSMKDSTFKILKEKEVTDETEIRLYADQKANRRSCFILYTEPYGITERQYRGLYDSCIFNTSVYPSFDPRSLTATFKFYKVVHLVDFFDRRKKPFNLKLIL